MSGRQWAQARDAFLMRPHGPGFAIETVYFDIGDDHSQFIAGLSLETDACLLTYSTVAAVTADKPLRGKKSGFPP